ncbi:hypothetical protein SAMN04515674_112103 [Pseudarcicella hirudinis]|uniref:Type 1 periplasmic binding fold superfamily protein n=1 Tax=Pseudarcicella hirudinis TaxID=1079859 RepID=A0A1I5WPU9_9BACT|nr:hypothetical protein [Pseudarcicella hirudinis]SFQ21812.1 hypothetical protein SAMN04515674_112103 [Pseudarcicella hirudinis]
MKLLQKSIWTAALLGLMMTSCSKKDDPQPVDDNELITAVKLSFTEGGVTKSFNARSSKKNDVFDIFDTISLQPNKTYSYSIEILDESKTPVDDITAGIKEEKDMHLFVFKPNPASLIAFTDLDKDSRNLPVGLTATVKTGAAGTGKLQVILRHQPPVNGKPVKDGTETPGSTDMDITLNVEVK